MVKKFNIKNKTFYKLIVDDCELIFCDLNEIENFLKKFNYNYYEIKQLTQNI